MAGWGGLGGLGPDKTTLARGGGSLLDYGMEGVAIP